MKNLILVQYLLLSVLFASCGHTSDQSYFGEEEYFPATYQIQNAEGQGYTAQTS